MSARRGTVALDSASLPACDRCGARAVLERDRHGTMHATWGHETDCAVLISPAARMQFDVAVAHALSASGSEAKR